MTETTNSAKINKHQQTSNTINKYPHSSTQIDASSDNNTHISIMLETMLQCCQIIALAL